MVYKKIRNILTKRKVINRTKHITPKIKVLFWDPRKDGVYKSFSNFSRCNLVINGVSYKSVEHFYQSMKFKSETKQQIVRVQKTARKSKDIARDWDKHKRKDWEDIKINVMRFAIKEKFRQNSDFATVLLSTRGQKLIENSPTDYFWGAGKDGSGKNWMGLLLMELRENELKKLRK